MVVVAAAAAASSTAEVAVVVVGTAAGGAFGVGVYRPLVASSSYGTLTLDLESLECSKPYK